jgi:hypothetical protein
MTTNTKHYAIIQEGKITNVIEWDGESDFNPDGELIQVTGLTPEPGIGWDYTKGKFKDNRPKDEDDE